MVELNPNVLGRDGITMINESELSYERVIWAELSSERVCGAELSSERECGAELSSESVWGRVEQLSL